jgi:Zn-finger nucleic acid-binding protein
MRLTSGNASLRCDYCKTVVVAAADDAGVQFLDEVEELMCPVCAAPLWDSVLAGIKIHACKQCHGLLVPMGDAYEEILGRMRVLHQDREIPPPTDPADLEQKVDCPQCHKPMDTHFSYGGEHAVMSACERCGLNWLNGGVLLRIVHAPQSEEAVD